MKPGTAFLVKSDIRVKSFARFTPAAADQQKKLAIKLLTEMLGHGLEEIQNLLVIAGTLQSQIASAQSESQTQKSKKLSHIILPRLQFMDVEVTDAPVGKNS